eukprot:1797701-Amphidinium_carterae.1
MHPDEEVSYHGAAAYLLPLDASSSDDSHSVLLTSKEVMPLTPILDTRPSDCLLPMSHLTTDEAEHATRDHLCVANGTLMRALNQ